MFSIHILWIEGLKDCLDLNLLEQKLILDLYEFGFLFTILYFVVYIRGCYRRVPFFFFFLTMTWQVLLDLWVWIYCWYLPVFVFWHLISEWKRRMCQRDNYLIKERQQPKTTIIFLQIQLSNITPGARGGLYLKLAS